MSGDQSITTRTGKRWRLAGPAVGFVAVGLLSLLLIAVSINARHASHQRREAEIWYAHTFDVLLVTSRLRTAVYAEMRGERGYLLTHNLRFLDPYVSGRADIARDRPILRWLTRDNPVQQRHLVLLGRQIDTYEAVMASTIATERAGKHDAAVAVVRSGVGKHHIDAVLATIDRMDREEKTKLRERRDWLDTAMRRGDLHQHGLSILGFLLLLTTIYAAWKAHRAQQCAALVTSELERHASTDALTGLANRRAFMAALERRLAEPAARTALAIVDIDHFKRINDTYGHPAGDEILRQIAVLAAAAVRGSDTVGRIGGEEFGILMPGATTEQAIAACERFRTRVNDHFFVLDDGRRLRATLSVGVASHDGDEDCTALIARADRALYDAKHAGRDRVLLAA